jgi:hypothetical protein
MHGSEDVAVSFRAKNGIVHESREQEESNGCYED